VGVIRTAIPAMAVGLAAASACGVGTFACSEDAQCGASGVCEPSGYCSFVDDACPSGRRYGSLAPKELADRCVVPIDESTGGVAEGTTTTSTTIDPSTSSSTTTTSSTTMPVDPTTEGEAESSGAPPGTESSAGEASSSSSEPPPPACDVVFVDDFEDGVIDPEWDTWSSTDTYFAEQGGHLVLSIGASAVDWISAGLNTQLHSFLGGHARAELVPFGDPLEVIGVWLTIFDENDCEVQIAVEDSSFQIKAGGTWYDGGPIDSTQAVSMQLRIDGDGYVHWEYSTDGETWTEIHGEAVGCDFSSARSAIFGGGMHDYTDPIVREVESYERCEAQ
jgi:hypothetical protein